MRPSHQSPIEGAAPTESLTVYRALAVCHVAGVVLCAAGYVGGMSSVRPGWAGPLTLIVVAQTVAWSYLLWRAHLVPRIVLAWPVATWLGSITLAIVLMAGAVSYVAYGFTAAAAAWVATATAVGPRRRWLPLGLGISLAVGAIWLVGPWQTSVSGERPFVAWLQLAAVFINAAWLGAAGNEAAWRLRRWGVVVAADAGVLDQVRRRAAEVRRAADRVLSLLPAQPHAREADVAIGIRQLRSETDLLGLDDHVDLHAALRATLANLQTPFDVHVDLTPIAPVPRAHAVAVTGAVLRHMTNVLRHAPLATNVWLTANPSATALTIRCEDDGSPDAPEGIDEGEGTRLSRDALHTIGGTVRYERGARGVALELSVPHTGAALQDPPPVGLADEVRRFIEPALRANRLTSYASSTVLMVGAIGTPWPVVGCFLLAAVAIEWLVHRMGPATATTGPRGPLVLIGLVAVAVAALCALSTESIYFPAAAGTAWPLLEIARRGRWWLWGWFEVLRAVAVLPYLERYGAQVFVTAFVFPLVITIVVFGASRLLRRADELDQRVGSTAARRDVAVSVARAAALRHDVVDRVPSHVITEDLRVALAELDRATMDLGRAAGLHRDEADETIAAVRAMLDPIPVEVEDGVSSLGRAEPAPATGGALAHARRLDRLERSAEAAADLVFANPPGWMGRRRLRAVRARVETSMHRPSALQLTPVPGGTAMVVPLAEEAVA